MSTMEFGYGIMVTMEGAEAAFKIMDAFVRSRKASDAQELVDLPRGVSLVAGGFVASELFISNKERDIGDVMNDETQFWKLMIAAFKASVHSEPLEFDGSDARALKISDWAGYPFPGMQKDADKKTKTSGKDSGERPKPHERSEEDLERIIQKLYAEYHKEVAAEDAARAAAGSSSRRSGRSRRSTCSLSRSPSG